MVLEITFQRLLFQVAFGSFLGSGIGFLLDSLVSLIMREKYAATSFSIAAFIFLSISLLLVLLSPCIH